MFEALKTLIKGWEIQGRHPGVSPAISRPYVEVAAAFLEQKIPLEIAMKTVATHPADVKPFVLTYTTMPFVIGGVCAGHALGRESKQFSAVLDMLKEFAAA